MRLCIIWIVAIIVIVVVVALVIIYSGAYSVSARRSDGRLVTWFLDTTMTRSVQRHASGIKAPQLTDPAMIREGFSLYRSACVQCHGAPGVPIGDIGQGLNPAPPSLDEAVGDWTPAELFWITKYGVRMTGMPAWGPTHSDDQIWSIVAFLRTLPSLTPAQYNVMLRKVQPAMK